MYLRVTLSGTLGTTEVWSVNPCFDFGNAFSPTWDQTSGDAVALAISNIAIPSNMAALWSSAVSLTGVRVEGRDDDHELLGVSTRVVTPAKAGSGTATNPPQAAWVASLRTNQPGASGRGRLYWPAIGAAVAYPSFRLSSTFTQNFVDASVSYLDSISDAIQANAGLFPWTSVRLCVVSKTRGARYVVNRIQGGDVVDTQRRRRDALPENYQSAVYPPA